MTDYLSIIKRPIERELNQFVTLFNSSLTHQDKLQEEIFARIRNRAGKRMRPMLIMLMAKNYGRVTDATLHASVGLELLHTASLVHDDVVDESRERRGQASVNALYDNKVAVLVGDYILSTALLHVSMTHNELIVRYLAELGRTLSDGEILQLTSIGDDEISEDTYYKIISRKTAALFEACCAIGAISAGMEEDRVGQAKRFGQTLGIIFQIRDDIFDPVIYALRSTADEAMLALARKVKQGTVTRDEIAALVDFTKRCGGIEYAERRMDELHAEAQEFIRKEVNDAALRDSLKAYLDFVIKRSK